jgi:hypothetical protein
VKQLGIDETETLPPLPVEEVKAGERVRRRRLGLFAGEATMHAGFDELPADIAAAFGVA